MQTVISINSLIPTDKPAVDSSLSQPVSVPAVGRLMLRYPLLELAALRRRMGNVVPRTMKEP